MSAIFSVILLIFVLFIIMWALIVIGAKADQNMGKMIERQAYFANYDQLIILDEDLQINKEPEDPRKGMIQEICPVCKHENWIPKGTCSRCEVCFTKIGLCDE